MAKISTRQLNQAGSPCVNCRASQRSKSGSASNAAEENGAADAEPGSCAKSAGGSRGHKSAQVSDPSKPSATKMLGDKRRKSFAHATAADIPRLQGIMDEEVVLSRRRGR